MIMKNMPVLLSLTLLVGSAGLADARVKLAAMPERARVVVSLTHPNATLLEEERLVTLQKGVNQVDFSWNGVSIDPNSIQLRRLGKDGKVVVLNTSYPPKENALLWEISSDTAHEERFRVSYLLAGLTREIVYKAIAAPDEKTLTLRNYLRLLNKSGEDLSKARFSIGYGEPQNKTLAHEEVLEMLSEKVESLPIRKVLSWDAAVQPWDPEYQKATVGLPLTYVFTNSVEARLGTHTLLPGKARLFIATKDSGDGEGVAFTGEDWLRLTPVDREVRLLLGQSRDVKVTQRQIKNDRTHIRRSNSNQDVVWDTDEIVRIEIENFKKEPVDLVIVEHVPGCWKMIENSHSANFRRKDAFTFEYELKLPAESRGDKKTVITYNLNRLNVQGDQEPRAY
jgi:hypothetical protein